jgi:hypothetical protein
MKILDYYLGYQLHYQLEQLGYVLAAPRVSSNVIRQREQRKLRSSHIPAWSSKLELC